MRFDVRAMISFPPKLHQIVTAGFTLGSRRSIYTPGSSHAFTPPFTSPVATLRTTPHWLERCSRASSVGEEKDENEQNRVLNNGRVSPGDEKEELVQVSRHSALEKVDEFTDKSSNTIKSNAKICSRHHDLVKHILRLKARRRYRSNCGEMVVLGMDTLRSISSLHSKTHPAKTASNDEGGTTGEKPWKPEASLLVTDSPAVACNPESLGLHAAQTRLTTSDIMNIVLERKQPAYTTVAKAVHTPQKLNFPHSTTHAQTAAIFPQPQPAKDFVRPRFVLALDRLRYVWNVGILLRCAKAMKVDALFFVEGTADPFNWKTLEISKGLHCHIPYRWGNSSELLKMCEKHNLAPIVADLRGDPLETLRDRIGDHEGVCCILGSESRGPSQEVLRHAIKVALPMAAYVDSLNVGIAGGIILSSLSSFVISQSPKTLETTCMHAASV